MKNKELIEKQNKAIDEYEKIMDSLTPIIVRDKLNDIYLEFLKLNINSMSKEEIQLIVNAIKTCPESERTLKDKVIIIQHQQAKEQESRPDIEHYY